MNRPSDPVATRWSEPSIASDYARDRWRSRRARERDPRLVETWLSALDLPVGPRILDVPSGTGRLKGVLETFGERTAVDASAAMVREEGAGLVGSITQLPFHDDSFDVVVVCRLLHHLREPEGRVKAMAEALRVSKRYVIASFWDRASLHGWRGERKSARRDQGSSSGRIRTRHAIARRQLFDEFESCGGRVLGVRHSFRFISQQAFVAVEKVHRA